jgi:hypothetical protein
VPSRFPANGVVGGVVGGVGVVDYGMGYDPNAGYYAGGVYPAYGVGVGAVGGVGGNAPQGRAVGRKMW